MSLKQVTDSICIFSILWAPAFYVIINGVKLFGNNIFR